jgi:hypothetical protein
MFTRPTPLIERHFAVNEREQSPIAARADVVARHELGPALADDDAARADDLPRRRLSRPGVC